MSAEEITRLQAEVEHWKAHADEAGRGFTAVCETSARISARNVELVEALARIEALAERWRIAAGDSRTDYFIAMRSMERELRAVLTSVTTPANGKIFSHSVMRRYLPISPDDATRDTSPGDPAFEKALAEVREDYREALDRLSDDTVTSPDVGATDEGTGEGTTRH